jgi:hypothetical protein
LLVELGERARGRSARYHAAVDRATFLAQSIRHMARDLAATVADLEQAYRLLTDSKRAT